MLPNRLSDLERDLKYDRFQIEVLVRGEWRKRAVYACPPGKLSQLLANIPMKDDMRLRRVFTDKADLALITDTIVTTVIP